MRAIAWIAACALLPGAGGEGSAMARTLLKEGAKAPAFTAQDTSGNTVRSEDLIGKKPFVLWFYPKDDTPG